MSTHKKKHKGDNSPWKTNKRGRHVSLDVQSDREWSLPAGDTKVTIGKVALDDHESGVSDASTETAENQEISKSSEIQGPLLTDHTNIGQKRKL